MRGRSSAHAGRAAIRAAIGAAVLAAALCGGREHAAAGELTRLEYRRPGLVVDLGVGLWAWPLPLDRDGDGDIDLLVVCPDVPSGGVYFFENRGGDPRDPVFAPGVRVADGERNVRLSMAGGKPVVTLPGRAFPGFLETGWAHPRPLLDRIPVFREGESVRANEWHIADFDGDGLDDLLVGIGDWSDYGWDDAFNERGEWTRGPLHGRVYILRRRPSGGDVQGESGAGAYEPPREVRAGGRPIDVFGMPSPCLADFDGDGDLDLICGEFLDRFTYFENTGTRTEPRYAAGRFLTHGGETIRMHLCMIVPAAVDFDRDGDVDLVVGQEDGRVAFLENTGTVTGGLPGFEPPRFLRQEARAVKYGALVTPVSADWDGDGDEDLVCGNTSGSICVIENLDGGDPPSWAPPRDLEADGVPIRIQAGPNGSIQGPAEAKWGYTVLDVADWDHDGRLDLVVNSIWGEVLWYRNRGTRQRPVLSAAERIEVDWPGEPPRPAWNWWKPRGKQLVTQWRTSPVVRDIDGDGLNDLVILDHEGYLTLLRRVRRGGCLHLLPPERIFRIEDGTVYGSSHRRRGKAAPGSALRLNAGTAGHSGRRKFTLVDWDRDGRLDLLADSRSVTLLRNVATEPGTFLFRDMGPLTGERLAGHSTAPATVDWDGDGVRDLLVGAEDGFLYLLRHAAGTAPKGRTFSR